jgi:5-methylcytosine-specific restriction endonuclease McrA
VTLSGSREQKRARMVLDRDDTVCHVCGNPGADQVDHVIALAHGGADTDENLGPIHSEPCHREKTLREAQLNNER